MSYIGNTPTTQAFTPAVDFFNGNGSTTAFTLSRPVASVAQVQAVIENVPQNPGDAFTVSGNTITFTSAPPSGTQNIYVYYTSPITQVIAPGQSTVGTAQLQDGAVTTAKIADANVTVAKLSATGTPSSSTYLRGDNTWASVTSLPGTQGQAFTTTGSGQTFTIPAGVTAIKVTVVGGGGGSGNGGGGAGGTSSVASGTQSITTVSATGGAAGPSGGAGGTGSSGTLNMGGQTGLYAYNTGGCFPSYYSFPGGASFMGGGGGQGQAGKAYGGGAGGVNGTASYSGGGGGAAIRYFTGLTPGNTLTVTVGAGGTGGTNGGLAGGQGVVFFEW